MHFASVAGPQECNYFETLAVASLSEQRSLG
ncbi:hypothetical protein CFU_0920 [Collimonas fungivorans Ter331]|uniref:Uncharacterized protein n=1 Tax=Collimonas fungivorans (strain Ter331) TaxID=1005048 RepID=G0AIG9_COLFT|nr:hypothetical protein CFU_0920 [Collimonas fungivorans Ter331]